MSAITQIIPILIIALIALIAYNFLKPIILKRFKPNKWIVLILLILAFFSPMLLPTIYSTLAGAAVFFALITILTLTFMDILKEEKIQRNKPPVGKPKAKQNRAKK